MEHRWGVNTSDTGKDAIGSSQSQSSAVMVEIKDPTRGNYHGGCKYGRLDCPRFDASDFAGWRMKIDQFFEADGTDDSAKIRTVMLHLEGRALQWH